MSRSSFKAHAVDASGAVLTSASVTVRDQSGVVISPSALFTAYSGTGTHASNPFTATGGLISFYVEGSQVVTVSAVSGGTSQTWSNVVLNELIEPSDFATSAQGTKADTATQPADLGTAAATDSTDYATAAQGALADSALQAADVGTAAAQDSTAFATTAQGALADSATQPADLGTAAALDHCTSDQDSTNGKVLRVGNFGLGTKDVNDYNSDSFVGSGFFRGTTGSFNSEFGSSWYTVQIQRLASAQTGQLAIKDGSTGSPPVAAINHRSATGVWSTPVELWTTGNLTKGTGATDVPTNADLGTAAAADLTTSATDITAGRVLKAGDWGVGTDNGPTITDFSSHYKPGFYRGAGGTASNYINAVESFRPIIVAARSGTTSKLSWGELNGAMYASIYYTNASNATYSAQLWTTDNLTKGTGATDVPTNADLGTAAQADLTTSATDTTAGRVLKVGDFGLGSGPVTLSDYTTMESVARVFREVPSTVGGSGDDTYGVLAIPVSGTPRTAFFKLSGANKMFVGNKTGSGSSPSFSEVWTTSNYQPETSLGSGVSRKMKNKSGGAIADQAQVAGSDLKAVYTDSSGVEQENPATIGGTWINVSGMSVGNNEAAEFTKL